MNNLNDKSTLCNEKDDCKEIMYILRLKKESDNNLSSVMNSHNSNRRRLISIKGNVLFNSINNDSTFSNSPYRSKNYIDENSPKNTPRPLRVTSNFFNRIALDYDNNS